MVINFLIFRKFNSSEPYESINLKLDYEQVVVSRSKTDNTVYINARGDSDDFRVILEEKNIPYRFDSQNQIIHLKSKIVKDILL